MRPGPAAVVAAALAVLLPALAPLAAQEQPAPAAPEAAASASPARTAADLAADSLGTDVETASYYELVAWCRGLALAETGSRRELQDRLREHYKLPAPGAPAEAGRTVTVRSARSAEYFTIEQADETYLVLSGDVVIELRDAEAGATHTIRAGRLTYNQARRTLAAGGGVVYTLEEGGRIETFEGRSLSLDLDTWEAAFTDGRTSKTQSRGDQELTFSFEGSSITRLSGDQVLLEDGTFTSCDLVDPHYAVRARKVWILAAGEWALRDAVLTVGRVPVLWMPVFFYPGDKLVFNPSFGFRQREGAYVQTTTYLMGRRSEEESLFSFLKVNEAQGTAYDQELHGVFLRKLPTRATTAPKSDATLKLLLDAYSRLGVFAGVAGNFPPAASFDAGIAFSRSLFVDPATGLYTPFYPYGTVTDVYPNSSVLLGVDVPFRFGFKADARAATDAWTGALHFELYSDPSFTSDFYGRSEGFRLSETLEPSQGTAAGVTNSFAWELTNKFDLGRALHLPAGQTLVVPYLNSRFSWLSRQQPPLPDTPEGWPPPGASDPSRTFYYPSSIAAPTGSLTASGTILRLGGAQARGAERGAPAPPKGPTGPGKGYHDPFAPEEPGAGGQAPAAGRHEPRAPAPRPDASLAGVPTGPSLEITYQAAPRFALEHTFDAADWQAPEDIDLGILYGTFETAGTGRVQAAGSIAGGRLGASLAVGLDSLWRLRFNPAADLDGTPEWLTLLQRDLQQDRLDFTSTLAATARPFPDASAFRGSTLSWRLGLRLFQLRWDKDLLTILDPRFETTTVALSNPATVSEHSLLATAPFALPPVSGTLSMNAVLPPLDGSLTARFDAAAWFFTARVQAGAKEVSEAWQAQPLAISLSAEPWKGIVLSEDLQVSLEGDGVERSTTQLRALGFTASFVAARLAPVDILTGLPTGPVAFLPSSIRLGFDGGTGPLWSWKDRVRLEAGLRTGWSMNVQRYTDNLFEFAPRLTLAVHEALDLTFSSLSVNTKTYRYIPGLPEAVSESWVNPVVDLVRSFNFFDTRPPSSNDRYRSAFKIRSLSLKAVHHLHDWDLSFEYTGSPKLVTDESGARQYEWSPVFTIQLQWIPVPEVKAAVSGDRVGVQVRQ